MAGWRMDAAFDLCLRQSYATLRVAVPGARAEAIERLQNEYPQLLRTVAR